MSTRQYMNTSKLLRTARFSFLLPLFVFLLSCATSQQDMNAVYRADISWPLANSHNRVVWVKNISGPADIGNHTGFWQRIREAISGREQSTILRPYGVLRTAAGSIYVTDPGRGIVHCFDITKNDYSVIGNRQDSPLLRSPIGLAEDSSGRIYITDSVAGMVYRFTPDDNRLQQLLSQPLERPTGIAFNPANRLLYVSDTLANQIIVLNQNGIIQKRINGHALGGEGFNRPTDLAIDARGQIYVTDSLNFRITILTPEGQVIRQFGKPGDVEGSFSRPKGIAVDSSGNIYVNDSLMDAVQIFNQNGDLRLVFGKNGTAPGQFIMPSGLFIDRLDQIYVADTYNRRIQVFKYLNQGDEVPEEKESDQLDRPIMQ